MVSSAPLTKPTDPSHNKKRILVHAVAGVASSMTIQMLHPFDLIKTRFQAHDSGSDKHNAVPRYRSVLSSIKDIVSTEGKFSLFKGVSINLIAGTTSYGFFFGMYERFRQSNKNYFEGEFLISLVSSTQAAAISSAVMQPAWVLKTRRMLDTQKGGDLRRGKEIIKQIWKDHGIRGFYRGYSLSLALGLYGTIQLTTYATLKDLIETNYKRDIHQKEIAGLGIVARFMSSLLLHPLTTVRTRFQQN